MNSLNNIYGLAKKATITLMIASCLTMTVFAQKTSSQSQKSSYGNPGFTGESIDLTLVNADVRDVLSFITQQYGVNFVIDKSVKQVPVTVNLNDVPWNMALDSILQSQGLAVEVNGPILRVADVEVVAKEASARKAAQESQLDRSPLYTEFIRLNYASASGNSDSTSTKSGVSSTGSESSAGGSTGGAGILGIIKRRVSRRGSVETEPMSNTLIITDVRENIDAIRQLVSLLDQPQPQVEIEARIVVADRSFSRDIGVQLGALALGQNGRGISAGTLPGNGSNGTGGTSTGFTPNGAPNGLIISPNNSLISSLTNGVIGLTTGIFGTAQISMLITAGENTGQAKTIATPRVTTMNNRKAEISSGQQIPIVTPQTSSGGSGGSILFTTTYVNVPLRLEVIPQITDAGTVLLDVTAENSTVPATTSAGVAPPIKTSQMKTYVLVPDGGTTVVGGALLDSEGESQNRTPGLSKIPVIKNLFRRKGVSKVSSEILFFITPRIYRPDYNGNPMEAKPSNSMRSTTLLQPVPLGNPPSNSDPKQPELPVMQAQPQQVSKP